MSPQKLVAHIACWGFLIAMLNYPTVEYQDYTAWEHVPDGRKMVSFLLLMGFAVAAKLASSGTPAVGSSTRSDDTRADSCSPTAAARGLRRTPAPPGPSRASRGHLAGRPRRLPACRAGRTGRRRSK